MCTHARSPSPSSRKLIASSKSFAVVRVDREGEQIAEVDARRLHARGLVGERAAALAGHRALGGRTPVPTRRPRARFDRVVRAEHVLDPRPPAARVATHNEIADGRVAGALAVDDDRRAGLEERLADEELPARETRRRRARRPRHASGSTEASSAQPISGRGALQRRFAARSASSVRVSGSSTASTFGWIPCSSDARAGRRPVHRGRQLEGARRWRAAGSTAQTPSRTSGRPTMTARSWSAARPRRSRPRSRCRGRRATTSGSSADRSRCRDRRTTARPGGRPRSSRRRPRRGRARHLAPPGESRPPGLPRRSSTSASAPRGGRGWRVASRDPLGRPRGRRADRTYPSFRP